MIEYFENIDRDLFLFLNGINAEWADPMMKAFSAFWFWYPVVAFIIFLYVVIYKRRFWIPLLVTIICFAITDQVSHQTKEIVKRYRPTHNTEICDNVHIVDNHKGGMHSFFSGHAASGFGLAFLSILFIRNKYFSIFVLTWAFVETYSRIYVGVHYPSDLIFGALFGTGMAFLMYFIHKKIPFLQIQK